MLYYFSTSLFSNNSDLYAAHTVPEVKCLSGPMPWLYWLLLVLVGLGLLYTRPVADPGGQRLLTLRQCQ